MPSFKPVEHPDSQAKLKSDIAHDVKVGGKAKISLGGMSTAILEITGIGKDGVSVKDSKGRSYQFHWSHVIAPAGADEKTDDAKAAASPKDDAEPMTKALPAKKEAPHRALNAGDSIYFSDATGQAQHGLVASVGRHGAQVDVQGDDGKTTTHNVRHASIVGHRKRAERKLIIIDRGEDGSIATDEQGKRVFLRGQLPDSKGVTNGDTLTKSLAGDYQPADDTKIIAIVQQAIDPVLTAMAAMQKQHHQTLDRFAALVAQAIGKPLPAINLTMPDQPAPSVHVDVNVPDSPAPVVHVAPASVSVNVPEQQQISIISMPTRQTEAIVERDRDGNIKSSTNIERDAAL